MKLGMSGGEEHVSFLSGRRVVLWCDLLMEVGQVPRDGSSRAGT